MADASCRCARYNAGDPSCQRPITQEDLLCDQCRKGCARIASMLGDGEHLLANHLEMAPLGY